MGLLDLILAWSRIISKKLVMDNISSSNTESMILARLIYQHPVTSKVDDVDIDREFRRYEARQGRIGILSNPVSR